MLVAEQVNLFRLDLSILHYCPL